MRGTVKWFNAIKGYGFIKGSTEKDIFVHYTNINIKGFRTLDKDDIVDFKIGAGKDGREQALNVTPIITRKMVKDILKKDNLFVQTITNLLGNAVEGLTA